MAEQELQDIVSFFWDYNAELRAESGGKDNYFKIEYSISGVTDTSTRIVSPNVKPNLTQLNPMYTVCITQIRQYVVQKKYKPGDLVKLNLNSGRSIFNRGSVMSVDPATGRYQIKSSGKKLYVDGRDLSPLDLCNNCDSANKSFLHISGGVSIENQCVYLNLMNHIIIDNVIDGPGLVLTNASLIVRNISGYGSCETSLVVGDCCEVPPVCEIKSDCCNGNTINLCKSDCLCGGLAFIVNADINTYGLCKLAVDGSSIDINKKRFAQCPSNGLSCSKNGGQCGSDKIVVTSSLSPPCTYYKINLFLVDSVVNVYLLPLLYTTDICNKDGSSVTGSYTMDMTDGSSCSITTKPTTTTDTKTSCNCDTEDVIPKVLSTVGAGYFEISDPYSNSNLFVNKLTRFNLVKHTEFNLAGDRKSWNGFLNIGGTRNLLQDDLSHTDPSVSKSLGDICYNYDSSGYCKCSDTNGDTTDDYYGDEDEIDTGCVFGECNNIESVPWCYILSADFYLYSVVASILNGTFDKFGKPVEVKYVPNNDPCLSGCKRSYVKIVKYHGINRYFGQLNISVCADNTLPIRNSNVNVADCGSGSLCNTVTFDDEDDTNIGCDNEEDPQVNLSVVISSKNYLSQYQGNYDGDNTPPGTPLLLVNSWLLRKTQTNYSDQIFTDENCETSAQNYNKQRIIVFYSPDCHNSDDDFDNCYALAINPKKRKRISNWVYIGGDYGKYCYY